MIIEHSIWITGIGAASPLGNSFSEISANLLAGTSAIRPVWGFDTSQHPCRIAGQLAPQGEATQSSPDIGQNRFPLDECAISCACASLVDGGLWDDRHSLRIGLVLGVAAEAMSHWDTDVRRGGDLIYDQTKSRVSTAETVIEALELSGPFITVAAACASGNHALAQAREWIDMGWVDICLAGACDLGVTPYSLASFGNLRALSRRNDAPKQAVRPFDLDRDGMVLGEGGAVFVLEREERARARGQNAYAEIASVGMTSDAYHLVTPSPDPTHAANAMRQALSIAKIAPEEVDYVNAHATGTPVGDVCEARALQSVFGPNTEQLLVSSTKSMTGHLLGAAAAIEALACMTAISAGAIPPTINLDRPDPACPLCHVANFAVKHDVRVTMSNSFGFGGHNTALLLRRPNHSIRSLY